MKFETKKEALKHLKNNPLSCVQWDDMSAIYWNGKLSIQKADLKKYWS